MKMSNKIAIAALALSFISALVIGTYYVSAAFTRVNDVSQRVGDPNDETGIYGHIAAEVKILQEKLDQSIGNSQDRSGVYGVIYRLSTIPTGTILPWVPTKAQPKVPEGWVLCDGTGGTPNLRNMFLRGVTSRDESTKTGGTGIIPDARDHNHGGRTTGVNSNQIEYSSGGDNNGVWFNHSHGIGDGGAHNHGGDNLPPFYNVMYVMKVG